MPRTRKPHFGLASAMPALLYGGDYNPEQWPEGTWAEDAHLMREAGVNFVTIGVFSWTAVEPSPGTFRFEWLDRVLDLMDANGVKVDLATGTASPPRWLTHQHPEVLPVTAEGVRLGVGSRQHYCPSSHDYREAASAFVRRLAERYARHPALAMWHINNEFGDHVHECFCEKSASAFRGWLEDRYGEVDALNQAWGTVVWSQSYRGWDEVTPPRAAPGPINPSQQLDWRRFSSDALLECFLSEREVLDQHCPGVPVTTNFMGMFKYLDYWHWAQEEDVVSTDSYPDPADPASPARAALSFDLTRSLAGGGPWLLMEQAPSAVSWRHINVVKPPGQRRIWAVQALARGAEGVLFFQWRASRSGAEKFHSSLLPHQGTRSTGWAETLALGQDLREIAEVCGAQVSSEVAMLIDWPNWWALEGGEHPSNRATWEAFFYPWYEALFSLNVATDFVRVGGNVEGYRLLLVPNLHLMSDDSVQWLDRYVTAGGNLVMGPFSGIVDESDHVHPGGQHRHLDDVLGIALDEWCPLLDGERIELPNHFGGPMAAAVWTERISTTTASERALYGTGHLKGRPAITVNARGAGKAWYVSCCLVEGVRLLMEALLLSAAVPEGPAATKGVELVRRCGSQGTFLFALNHTDETASVDLGTAKGFDLLTGTATGRSLLLRPRASAVVRLAGPDGST